MGTVFTINFDPGTIKHLGLQMYSTLPPVIGELVSNAWDADATSVDITIPIVPMGPKEEIVIIDNGCGMTQEEVQNAYLVVGRDRRKGNHDTSKGGRRVMGRKGIGKFSAFGVAVEIEIETVKDGNTTRFVLNYADFERDAASQKLDIPSLLPTGTFPHKSGTRITLRKFVKYRTRPIDIALLRKGLARRFSVIGRPDFSVSINNNAISIDERDLIKLLDKDIDGNPYLWRFTDDKVDGTEEHVVSGWIGALDRTGNQDGIQRGIAILARGKMVQEPFTFDAIVGQQFALSYLVGELHAEFVDEEEDTVGTTRNALVWDAGANAALKKWGQDTVNRIAREWAAKRAKDQIAQLEKAPAYTKFRSEMKKVHGESPLFRIADQFVKKAIINNPVDEIKDNEKIIEFATEMVKFDAFTEMSEKIEKAGISEADMPKVIRLFKEWEVLEAKEMMRVTRGRINTIKKLKYLIDTNALEVPTLHNFLKSFPWVLDPRWTLVSDETRFSDLLRKEFPEPINAPEEDRRIDFLCVSEGEAVIVVEIKRPSVKASEKELNQIEQYVDFIGHHIAKTTDPALQKKQVFGYLLVGGTVSTYNVSGRIKRLSDGKIYVRLYSDLLSMVEAYHKDFLERYNMLQQSKGKELDATE